VRETIDAGRALVDAHLSNVFERVVEEVQPGTARAMSALRAQGLVPHLCGAGPSFFLLAPETNALGEIRKRIEGLGFQPLVSQVRPRADATRVEHA
jgi:hypothetical protein